MRGHTCMKRWQLHVTDNIAAWLYFVEGSKNVKSTIQLKIVVHICRTSSVGHYIGWQWCATQKRNWRHGHEQLPATNTTTAVSVLCWHLNRRCTLESAVCRRSNRQCTLWPVVCGRSSRHRMERSPTEIKSNSSDLHPRGGQRQAAWWLSDSHGRIYSIKLTVFLRKCHTDNMLSHVVSFCVCRHQRKLL